MKPVEPTLATGKGIVLCLILIIINQPNETRTFHFHKIRVVTSKGGKICGTVTVHE